MKIGEIIPVDREIILNEGKIVKVLEGEERRQTSVDDLLNMYDFV